MLDSVFYINFLSVFMFDPILEKDMLKKSAIMFQFVLYYSCR